MENQKLPNATAVLILGIFSILTCCCYGFISIILGAIGLVLAKKDLQLFNENPSLYTNYNNLKIGRILSIIGIILGAIYLIYIVVLFSTLGMEGVEQMQQEMMRRYGGQ
ncbi:MULTISPECIES: CCC motif membrane protein [unclassified Flavobacterium]|jgi:hypothetical protein|uniref:CCC motif membrane protein n=1 Tax=unclassified Flavobacterium TaxID=196869 RepID=UPI0012921ECC|nr:MULTISPECIES: CCC motif membrane protein [unclassified Flavobacterium]MDP5001096.1 CCC motif membrane protein [Flavobacterium sp.]MDP5028797.1 CCC motif membrane protein [Flavobacterium sp.]MDP5096568.1 CCC motif membrane protein [Flavobacterium sp.]MQP53459.1 DUF4190 domain-containing protein [Flavobacterium sp. LMO9]MQP62911.1 DUF4190 domain-containing protein [Flavobacterium sp. LMO6]